MLPKIASIQDLGLALMFLKIVSIQELQQIYTENTNYKDKSIKDSSVLHSSTHILMQVQLR